LSHTTDRYWRFFYKVGFHPWEDLAEHPPFIEKLTELLTLDENGHEPPYGPALDVGCGSAVWGVKLAERGWQVTGVDIVERALERAAERIEDVGVQMRVARRRRGSRSRPGDAAARSYRLPAARGHHDQLRMPIPSPMSFTPITNSRTVITALLLSIIHSLRLSSRFWARSRARA
jgi:SAM-dependent methyltransferase